MSHSLAHIHINSLTSLLDSLTPCLSLSLSRISSWERTAQVEALTHTYTDTRRHRHTQTHRRRSRGSHTYLHTYTQTDTDTDTDTDTHTHTWAYWERTAEDEAGRELARVAEGRVCPPPPPLEAACGVDASGVVLVEFDAGEGEACVCVRRPGPCTHTLALYSPPPPSPPSLSRLRDL